MQLRGNLVTSRLIREEEEEKENWLRRDSFAPRVIPLFHNLFRREEAPLYLTGSVRWSVRWSVPMMQLRGKLVTSRLFREEQEEEENWLCRYSFAPRD
jgi:hypothetical protein